MDALDKVPLIHNLFGSALFLFFLYKEYLSNSVEKDSWSLLKTKSCLSSGSNLSTLTMMEYYISKEQTMFIMPIKSFLNLLR